MGKNTNQVSEMLKKKTNLFGVREIYKYFFEKCSLNSPKYNEDKGRVMNHFFLSWKNMRNFTFWRKRRKRKRTFVFVGCSYEKWIFKELHQWRIIHFSMFTDLKTIQREGTKKLIEKEFLMVIYEPESIQTFDKSCG